MINVHTNCPNDDQVHVRWMMTWIMTWIMSSCSFITYLSLKLYWICTLFAHHRSNLSIIQMWSCDLSLESWECALIAFLVHLVEFLQRRREGISERERMCGSMVMAIYIATRLEIGEAFDCVLFNDDAKYLMQWDRFVIMNHYIFPIEIIGDLHLFDNHKSNMFMI